MPYPKRSPEAEARRVEALRAALRSPEARANASEAAKRRYQRDGERELASQRAKDQLADPAVRATMAERRLESWRANRIGVEEPSKYPEYSAWSAMVQRCTNPKAVGYDLYGARGIAVTSEWIGRGGFVRFIEHIGRRPTPKHQIERIDNDGNYEPGNVRWATRIEQQRNTRRTRWIEIDGVRRSLPEWAELAGIAQNTIRSRLAKGLEGRALIEPSRRR